MKPKLIFSLSAEKIDMKYKVTFTIFKVKVQ